LEGLKQKWLDLMQLKVGRIKMLNPKGFATVELFLNSVFSDLDSMHFTSFN
jgi:hypothetical protein